ncbi:N-acetyltransferase 8-like isoform X2 [Prorops nasuta]|uniref:N-acetyltransferase 8-like isoform X2 n=1 Tax=Prorops nasuta TaxID=863751 RepID=UPI0034CF23EA
MCRLIVIRSYKSGDETTCKELLRDGIMSSLNTTFIGLLLKEMTFQIMILFAAILFIFFGIPFTICLSVIPVVIATLYIGTCISFSMKVAEVMKELSNISRIYTSNAFSGFWVAEAFEPYLANVHPKNARFAVMTEQQFRRSNIDVSSKAKNIVGTIGLLKSHRLDKGAWIKRLCVKKEYRRKGVASCLLNVVVQFAMEQGYSCADIVASEYDEGSLMTVLMYELTYRIKPGQDGYAPLPHNRAQFILE